MKNSGSSWKPFLVIFPALSLIPVGVLVGYGLWSNAQTMGNIVREERYVVDLQHEEILRALDRLAADVCMISGQNELAKFLADPTGEARVDIAAELTVFSRNTRIYDKVRYIDDHGQEIIRIDLKAGGAVVVPDDQLQNKSSRYFFEDAISLRLGQIYVSPLDLNVDHEEVEIPYKPTLRIATVVQDGEGERRGLIVMNYLARIMLRRVTAASFMSMGRPMMINPAGYWFLAPPGSTPWGFMLPGHALETMGTRFPDVWAHMSRHERGILWASEGLFIYRSYFPLNRIGNCVGFEEVPPYAEQNPHYRWIVASYVPEARLNEIRWGALMQPLLIGLPILGLLAVGTRAVTVVMQERRAHQAHLESLARVDALTGLANRVTFKEHLTDEIARAQRHARRFALLFLDLDGFKAINDTLGHEAGDRVLVDVARVLTKSCRAVDTPVRYGGDEFVVLLSEVADEQAAHGVAEKILAHIDALSWDGHTVGVSIGVAVWPDHSEDPATLIRMADAAMYQAKMAGKNRIRGAWDLSSR